jgi:hypothetical protein
MITLILTLALLGFLVYVITTYVPMPDIFKKLIYVITAIVVVLYLLRAFGVGDIPVPQVR